MCSAITRSWGEGHEGQPRPSDGADEHAASNGPGLTSTLMVFDTLAEACLVSFEERDVSCLASALGAMWAAEGALRNCSAVGDAVGDRDKARSNIAGSAPHPDSPSSMEGGETGPIEGGREAKGNRSAAQGLEEKGLLDGVGDDESVHSCAAWVKDSRTMDVIRSLVERCREYSAPAAVVPPATAQVTKEPGDEDSSADGGPDEWGAAGASMEGWTPALSLLDVGEAVVHGLGAEAAGDVLAACPRLIDAMPAKVRGCGGCRSVMHCSLVWL